MTGNTRARKRSATPATGKAAEREPAPIATRVRSIRRHKGITLERLSSETGLDRGYLSRVERGHKTPSLATLMKIGAALGVQMAHLFGETVGSSPITVVRRTQYKPFPGSPGAQEHAMMMIMPESETRALSLVMVSPGSAPAPSSEHDGEEAIFVLDGQIEVSFVDRKVTLEEGDCVHFDGHLQHAIRKSGYGRSRALIIVSHSSAKRTHES
jgi:transcriptional regulator with XRE-family HTH domain